MVNGNYGDENVLTICCYYKKKKGKEDEKWEIIILIIILKHILPLSENFAPFISFQDAVVSNIIVCMSIYRCV